MQYPVNDADGIAGKRCRLHGGQTPKGPLALQVWKAGNRSKDLPIHLARRVDEALLDPDLTSLAQEIALVIARIQELKAQLARGESESAWEAVASEFTNTSYDLATLNLPPDHPVVTGFARMHALLERHAAEQRVWADIQGLLELQRRLSDTERKREEMLQGNLSAKEAFRVFTELAEAMRRIVRNEAERLALATYMRGLVQNRGRGDNTTAPRYEPPPVLDAIVEPDIPDEPESHDTVAVQTATESAITQ